MRFSAFPDVVTNKPHVYCKPKFYFALMPGHDCIKGREMYAKACW